MVGITLFVPHKAEKKAVSSLLSNSANRDIGVLKSCIPLHTNLRRFWEGGSLSRHNWPGGFRHRYWCVAWSALQFSFKGREPPRTLLLVFHILGYSKMMFETAKKSEEEGFGVHAPFYSPSSSSKKGKLAFYCHFGRIRFSFAWLPLDESSVIILGGGGQLTFSSSPRAD